MLVLPNIFLLFALSLNTDDDAKETVAIDCLGFLTSPSNFIFIVFGKV